LGFCKPEYRDDVFSVLNDYGWCTSPCHEAVNEKKAFPQKLMEEIKSDKKQQSNKIRLVLQRGMNVNIVEEVPEEAVLDVLR
ncbi:MAG: 3-dehydroquinate synthase, partial [Spirochaetaceae bacterium]|nr:3-dehydroquinate synthase [Spirochaetaceae bacterium]